MEQEEQKPDPIKLAEKLRKEHSEKLAKNLASLGKSSLENDSKKEISAEESNTFTQKDFDRHEFDPETVPYSKDKYKDGVVHDEDVGKKKLEAKKAKKIPENSKESRSDNDAKDSAEKKAEKEKEAQERAEKIEELKQEVEKIRKEYLEADYKRKGAFKRLGNFFGKVFKEKEEKNLENDQEIAWYRAYYDDALMNYKNALLEDAKLKGASDEELLDIAKIFQVEANINIADINHQVKVENQEGRFSGFIKEHSMELVQRYKKLSLAKKIAIGAAFGGAALGAGYIGAAAVGAVGSAVAAGGRFWHGLREPPLRWLLKRWERKNRRKY